MFLRKLIRMSQYSPCMIQLDWSTPVVQWLSYSPLDPRFAGSIPARVDVISFGMKVKHGSRVLDLRHVKEPQAEIRASDQNLSDYSRSTSEATLMT